MSGRVILPSLFTVDGIARGSGIWSFGVPEIGWLAQSAIASSGENYICMGSAVAPDGSIYACGSSAIIAGNRRAWIAKFDADGILQWVRGRGFGTAIGAGFTDIAIGSDNNPVVTGWADNGAGIYQGFVFKIDSAGNGIAARRIGPVTLGTYDQFLAGGIYTFINGIDVNPATNEYYIVASSSDFGPLAGFAPSAYVLKFNPAGSLVWSRWINVDGTNTQGYSVAVDPLTGDVNVGCYSGAKAVIQKFSSAGVAGANQSWSNASGEVFFGMRCDQAGNIYAAGNIRRFAASTGWLLMKISPSLVTQWDRDLFAIGSNADTARVGVNATGNRIAIAGIRPHISGLTAGVAIFNDSGTLQWQRRMTDTAGASTARGAAFASNNQPVIAADAAVNGLANVWRLPSDGSGTGTYGGSIYTGADPLTVTPANVPTIAAVVTTGTPAASAALGATTSTPISTWSLYTIP